MTANLLKILCDVGGCKKRYSFVYVGEEGHYAGLSTPSRVSILTLGLDLYYKTGLELLLQRGALVRDAS